MRKSKGIPVLSLVLSLTLVGCGGKKFQEQVQRVRESKPEVEVSAAQLVADYRANEVKADVTYKGKVVAVKGQVAQVKKDLGGHPVVVLTPGKGGGLVTVRCVFDKSAIEATAGLEKGVEVGVRGIVQGKFGSVNMTACLPH